MAHLFPSKFLLLVSSSLFTLDIAASEYQKAEVMGYLILHKESIPEKYNAGFSLYPTVWPLLSEHPGRSFQTGFFGTWMYPYNEGNLSTKVGAEKEGGIGYNTIEGGVGYWRSDNFPTATPKFIMGGVAASFKSWANGPGSGKGHDWDKPKGSYGVAQLSPWVIFPLDGLNFKQGESGKSFGYGYLPLPLTEKKRTTYGKDVPQGNNSWTLFVNSKNFKGPLAFFVPSYWARHTIDYPSAHGKHLDSRPSRANRSISMETQNIPAIQATAKNGLKYARISPINFPIDEKGLSTVLSSNTAYTKAALWDKVDLWFKGGEVASGKIDEKESFVSKFKPNTNSTYKIKTGSVKIKLDWKSFAKVKQNDDYSTGYVWHRDWVKKNQSKTQVTLPEYYKLTGNSEKSQLWVPVKATDVPLETKLHQLKAKDFYTGKNTDSPIVTPEDEKSIWKTPGPKAGPYYITLGDGSKVTYYWYKFCEQPAIQFSDYSDEERLELQRRVELIHSHWKKDGDYLPTPSLKQDLVELDPAMLVKPPKGLEVGYVPIATHQK